MTCLTCLPLAASAQPHVAKGTAADVKYCHAMANSYSSLWPDGEGMPAADEITLERCDRDPQATIATLERMLKDEQIPLPPDVGIAQPPSSPENAQQREQ